MIYALMGWLFLTGLIFWVLHLITPRPSKSRRITWHDLYDRDELDKTVKDLKEAERAHSIAVEKAKYEAHRAKRNKPWNLFKPQ